MLESTHRMKLLTYPLVALVAVVILVSVAPQGGDAHSWAACVDWRFYKGVNIQNPYAFTDPKGKCYGYAREYHYQKPWATLDHDYPSRHFQQKHVHDPPACSNPIIHNGFDGSGAYEQKQNPISSSYNNNGKNAEFGPMTVTKKGSQLCLRWPAKNHAVADEPEHFVYIRMIPSHKETPNSLQSEFGEPIAKMPFKNCLKKGDTDKWHCGGCFTLPASVTPGMWTLQWRWLLNAPMEFYTSCADVQVVD